MTAAAVPDSDSSAGVVRPRGCTCFRLRRLTRRVTQRYDAHLAPTGLRLTQFSLLAVLHHDPAALLTSLADRMEMDRTTLTRNLRPLQAAGLVSVEPGRDARSKRVRLTAAGAAAFEAARPAWRTAQREIESLLGSADLTALHGRLDEALARVRAMPVEARP